LAARASFRAGARRSHVQLPHGTLYVDRTFEAVGYCVVATNPERDFVVRAFHIKAKSLGQAEEAAHDELINQGRPRALADESEIR
jgi:hypothetical protein